MTGLSILEIAPGGTLGDVSDAISAGLIHDVTTVGLVPGSVQILDDSVRPGGFTGPLFDRPDTNRAPLAASFTDLARGEEFTIAITHMKSKGGIGTGDDADAGGASGPPDRAPG
ncbi:hypothetical protein [Rhodovulum marinum]|uniref:Uncharacterized protein n=1 Tax=Rhodovulum marinum TaxID=320662 RepID=A0A4R2PSS5_9RHOB|nr:hypothetical protein [Rhodovulum marinum]TCP38919.1 hypothetical protein EV662_11673 [Rhodovulum marinum]